MSTFLPPVVVEITATDKQFVATLAKDQALLKAFTDQADNLQLNADTTQFQTKLVEASSELYALAQKMSGMPLGVDSKELFAQLALLRGEIAAMPATDLNVSIDTAGVLAKIEALKMAANLAGTNTISLGGGMGSGLGANIVKQVAEQSIMQMLGFKGGGGIGGKFASFGSIGSFAGFGIEHAITSMIGLGGSAMGGMIGGGLLGLGALGTGAVGMGTDMAGMGQALGDMKNVEQAQNAVNQALAQYQYDVKTYGASSQIATMALQNLQQAQSQLNYRLLQVPSVARGAVLALATTVQQFKTQFDSLTGPAEKVGAQILQQLVIVAEKFLPTIGQYALKNMGIIKKSLDGPGGLLGWLTSTANNHKGSAGGLAIFQNLESIFSKNLPTVMKIVTGAFEIFANTVNDAAGYTGHFIKAVAKFIGKINTPSGMQKWAGEVKKLIDLFRVWLGFFVSLVPLVYALFKPAVGFGAALVTVLTQIVKAITAWVKMPLTQSLLKSLFTAHLIELVKGFGDALKGALPFIEGFADAIIAMDAVVSGLFGAAIALIAKGLNAIADNPAGRTIERILGSIAGGMFAVAGMGAGFLLVVGKLSTRMGKWRSEISKGWTALKTLGNKLQEVGTKAWEFGKTAGTAIANTAKTIWKSAVKGATDLWNFAVQGAKAMWNFATTAAKAVADFAVKAATAIWNFVTTAAKAVADFAVKAATAIWNFVTEAIGSFVEFATTAWAAISTFVSEAIASFVEFATGAWAAISTFVAETATALWGFAVDGASAVASFAVDAGKAIWSFVTDMATATAGILADLGAWVAGMIGVETESVALNIALGVGVIGALIAVGLAVWYLATHWHQVWGDIKKWTGEFIGWIGSALKWVFNNILLNAIGPIVKLVTFIAQHWATIKTDTVNVWDGIINWFKTLPAKFVTIGSDIIQGLINGIKSLSKDVVNVVKNVAHSIWHGITSFFGINSPSTLMTTAGTNITQGLANGITAGSANASNASKAVAQNILQSFGSLKQLQSASGVISTFQTLVTNLNNLGTALGNLQKNLASLSNMGQESKGITALAAPLKELFVSLSNMIKAMGNTTQIKKLSSNLSATLSVVNTLIGGIIGLGKNAGQLQTALTNLNKLPGLLTSGFNELKSIFQLTRAAISGLGNLKTLSTEVKNLTTLIGNINTLFSNFQSQIQKSVGQVKASIGTLMTVLRNLKGIIESLRPEMMQAGYNLAQGLAMGIESGTSLVTQAAQTIAQAAVNQANTTLGIASPSKVMYQVGQYTVMGFNNALLDGTSMVKASMNNLVNPYGNVGNMGGMNGMAGGIGGGEIQIEATFQIIAPSGNAEAIKNVIAQDAAQQFANQLMVSLRSGAGRVY